MKLGIFTRYFPPDYSGAGQQATGLAQALASQGVEIEIVTPLRDSQYPKEELQHGVTINRLPGPWGTGRWSRFRLGHHQAAWLERRYSDWTAALCFSIGGETYAAAHRAQVLGLPLILRTSLLGSDDLQAIASARFGRWRMRRLSHTAAIVCTTKAIVQITQETVRDRGWDDRVRIERIPNGVDADRFQPAGLEERVALRRAHGIPDNAFVGITVGIAYPRKNLDLVLREWSQIASSKEEAQLIVLGPRTSQELGSSYDPDYKLTLEKLIRKEGLEDQLTWRNVEDVRPWLQASDVFLFASQEEGFPNALLEAMASGLPSVLVDRPWIPTELINSGDTAFVVSDSVGDMAEQVLSERANGGLARVALAGRARIESAFTFTAVAKQWIKLVQAVRN